MAAPHPFEIVKSRGVDVRELSCAVFGEVSVLLESLCVVSPQAWKHLVDY